MLKRMTLALLVFSFIFAGSPVQDSALNHFPDSTAMLIEVDMPAMLQMLRELKIDDFATEMKHDIVGGLLEKIDSVYVGLPEGEFDKDDALYVLMRSGLSVRELIDLAVLYDDEDHDVDIQTTQIGPFQAYYNAADDDESDGYIAQANGFIVAGTREGLLQYADVLSGKVANARGNKGLNSLRGRLPSSSSVRVYGFAPHKMGHIFDPETIAFGVGTMADNLNMHVYLTSDDINGLDKLERQITGLSGMIGMFDETGELSELLESLEVVRENDAIAVHLDVPIAKLHKIMQGKLGHMGDWH